MRALHTTIIVEDDGTVQVQTPVNMLPGEYAAVLITDTSAHRRTAKPPFPVIDVGPWPEGLSLKREDSYDDHGR